MITIFEGPDGAGKTTAALAHAKRTGAVYVHHGVYPSLDSGALERVYRHSILFSANHNIDVVLDRGWTSERVYGRIMRGVDRLGAGCCARIEFAAEGMGLVKVMCLPKREVALANFLARKEMEYLPDDHTWLQVYDAYEVFALDGSWRKYDYTRHGEFS